nr:hypothetical protein [Tanacetum cinerariifolium]
MVQINYAKLNALYETFVPQKDFSMEQTYFSIPSTSTNGSESKAVTSDLPIPKMPKESKLLKMFDTLDLLITISELKNRLKTVDKGKNVNTKFDKSKASRTLLCVTPSPKNITIKAKQVSNSKVNADRSKPVTSHHTPINEQGQTQNETVLARGINSNVKRALFTTPLAAKSKNLRTTFVVAKSRLSVDKTPKATNKVIQLVLWIVDSGCSKHTTGNLQLIRNFVEKFMGTIHFRNDHFTAITGYGDYVQVNLTIFHNLKGDDLLTGSRDSNLYTISISETAASSPVCLMSRATSTKSWLWHRRLPHLNFGTINQLMSKDLVDRLSKFKYNKDHLFSACEQGKSKKASLPPKLVQSTKSKLELLYINLCGPMRVASNNGNKYILVIVDDYSRYTWVHFLRTKDEALDMIIDFVNQVQRNLKAQILTIQIDNGTELKNKKLRAFYAKLGIVINLQLLERLNKMMFLNVEVNHSIVHIRYNKTPYELIQGRKPNIQYFHVFGSLCYPTNDRDDLGKIKPKADISIFIGY